MKITRGTRTKGWTVVCWRLETREKARKEQGMAELGQKQRKEAPVLFLF